LFVNLAFLIILLIFIMLMLFMLLCFLLPPSEGKSESIASWETYQKTNFLCKNPQPIDIATTATPKELKCTGSRLDEAIELNKKVLTSPRCPAIQRYTWVMFWAIDYETMSSPGQTYFAHHTLILSSMYWLLRPLDMIANYKLPVTTKLAHYRRHDVTQSLLSFANDKNILFCDMLSWPYRNMIDWKILKQHQNIHTCQINFLKKNTTWQLVKYTHWVKSVKWKRFRDICESSAKNLDLEQMKQGSLDVVG